jgi:hypothetical protein
MAEAGCLRDLAVQNLEVSGDLNVVGTSRGGFSNTFTTVARTALTIDTGAALAANINYTMAATDDAALTLPTQANSKQGDYITLLLTGPVDNTKVLKIGTDGEFFTAGSLLHVPAVDATRIAVISLANGTNDFLNITGLTNGDGGTGTFVQCYFNGSTWSINARVEGQGANSAASATTVFADS